MFIIGTTGDLDALKTLGLYTAFNKTYEMPLVENNDGFKSTIGETLIEIDDRRLTSDDNEMREYLINTFGPAWEVLV